MYHRFKNWHKQYLIIYIINVITLKKVAQKVLHNPVTAYTFNVKLKISIKLFCLPFTTSKVIKK